MNPFEIDWTVEAKVTARVTEPPKAAPTSHADITILMDRSASMSSMHASVVEGLNSYFDTMRKQPGDSRWTFLQFDDPSCARVAQESFPHVVFESRAEKDLTPLTMTDFQPRGSTALVDATCMALRQVDSRTSGQAHIKPIMMIVTDGQENASREFTSEKMREMIAASQKRGVEFLYLAANQDAWAVAGKYGLNTTYDAAKYGYAGSSTATGAVATGSVGAFGFAATADGIRTALASGMVGVFHTVSGSVQHGVRVA